MSKIARLLPVVGVVTAGVLLLTTAQARNAVHGNANADVEKLADAVNKPKEFVQLATDLAGNYEFEDVKWSLKPRDKGGIGVGAAAGAFPNDGVELELLYLAKKPPTAAELAAQAADLQRLADVVCAVAEATHRYDAKFTTRAKEVKRWNALADDMGEWGHELSTVVRKKDAKNLPMVVARLNRSCEDCHIAFRDSQTQPLDDVLQTAAVLNNADQLQTRAEALVRRYPLDSVSSVLKPRRQGGVTPAGIEADLLDLAKNPPAAADLPAQAPVLQQDATILLAIAAATPGYGKEYPPKAGAAKQWDRYSNDMKRGADDLLTALKANDPPGVQKAIGALNQSCTDCHEAYR